MALVILWLPFWVGGNCRPDSNPAVRVSKQRQMSLPLGRHLTTQPSLSDLSTSTDIRWTVEQALERPKLESIWPLAICTSHCLSFSLCGFIFTVKDALSYSWGMGKVNMPPAQQHELWSILEVQPRTYWSLCAQNERGKELIPMPTSSN